MAYVEVYLKCPEEGAWVAITRVDADGNVKSLGYMEDVTASAYSPELYDETCRACGAQQVDWSATEARVARQ